MLDMGKPLELLALAPDPPAKSLVVDAVLRLKELGGLFRFDKEGKFSYEDGDVSFLGNIMAALPLDVTLTRFIVMISVLSAKQLNCNPECLQSMNGTICG